MLRRLPTIEHGYRPKVLLLGNGLLRTYNGDSWNEFIKKMTKEPLTVQQQKAVKKLPYPFKSVVVSNDTIDVQLKKFSENNSKLVLPKEKEILLRKVFEIDFDAILTTNYTYDLETAANSDFESKMGRSNRNRFQSYEEKNTDRKNLLHQYYSMPYIVTDNSSVKRDGRNINIWHIHGEMSKPHTMIIGHYYYGKLLCWMQQYITTFLKRYKGCEKYGKDFTPISWIDYFLISDIYTIGFGFDLSETDMWWLVNCKKKHGEGHIYLNEPNISPEKELMATASGIIVNTKTVEKGHFEEYYEELIEYLRKTM